MAAVLGDTEDRWREIFEQNGQTYRPPKLRLFSGADASACGFAQAVMGPFYCPNDQHVYLDTSFFQDLQTRSHGCSGKACEFAEAYVIAHEVGHHVQNLLGILPKARRLQTESDRRSANHLQVQIELQADCLAGVWAHHSQQKWKFIEPGDVEAAMQRRDTRREGRKDKGVAVVDYALDNRPSTGGSGRSAVSITRHAPVGSCHRRGAVEGGGSGGGSVRQPPPRNVTAPSVDEDDPAVNSKDSTTFWGKLQKRCFLAISIVGGSPTRRQRQSNSAA